MERARKKNNELIFKRYDDDDDDSLLYELDVNIFYLFRDDEFLILKK